MKLKKLFLIIFSLCLTVCLACGLVACKEDGDNAAIPVASIGLDKTSLELEEGQTYQLIATVLPSNADDKTIIWSSDNTDVATAVDGLVTARAEGTARVSAKAGGFEVVCTVKVSKTAQSKIPVTSVTLNHKSYTIAAGGNFNLIPTVLPANATDREVKWSSSNEQVAVVVNGKVTAKVEGTATITATADGKSATCSVTVTKAENVPVEEVVLDRSSLSLKVGGTQTITATIKPTNSTVKEVNWSSSNENVATVAGGKVTAKGEGTATITATADGKSATCSVTVTKASTETVPVEEVVLDISNLSLKVGETQTITATIKPTNSTVKEVNWSSSNEKVATVAGGKVTAKGEGTATITATADGKSATCSVTVTKAEPAVIPVSGITLNSEKLELEVGETFTLTATVSPSNATDRTVVWNSESQVTATVEDGLVTAKAVGETIISATCGDVTVECVLTVKAKEDPIEPDQPITNSIITYAHAGEECAAFEWNDTNPSKAKVEYKLTSSGSYTQVDSQLVRQISATSARTDILGLKGGAKYDFKITSGDGKSATVTGVEISAYDRSGYAHHNYTGGVGGYNDDGTLKSNAKVIYVTEQNKNDIDGKGTSIAEYLAKTQKTPVVIRIIGTVGAATWKKGNVTYTKTSGNTDSSGNLLPEAIKGANGKALAKQDWTQADLISGGYNVLDTSKFSELEGLSSTIKWDKSKNEFDSCWNDCQVKISNITIEGVGEGAEIFQFGFTFKSCNSVEVRNLRFYDYTEDACSIEGSENSTTLSGFANKNFWVHHNTFDIGVNYWDVCKEQDKHDGDGSTDFKYISNVTVAYNRYNGTHKTGLVGGGDSHHQACFTFHHNYYNGCDQRMPLGRQANMHMYNNYYSSSGLYSISLRAGAYAFIENCVFTSGKSSTKPVEIVKGDNGVPSAKIINCKLDKNVSNGISDGKNLYVGSDRTATVEGDNLYGLNFELESGFYTVTDMLATDKVAGTIPLVAGVMQRKSNIKIDGGTEVDPDPIDPVDPDPVDPDNKNITMKVSDVINDGILTVSSAAQDFDSVKLADGIVLYSTELRAKVNAHSNTVGDISFTHRVVLKGKGNYFAITASGACTVKVYVANGSSTDTTGREIGLYKDAAANTLIDGAATTKLIGGEKQVVEYSVAEAGTFYLESITNELSIYQIEIIYQ